MLCSKCGKEIDEATRFCGYCGNEAMMKEDAPSPEASSGSSGETAPGGEHKKVHKIRNTAIRVVLITLVYLIVLAGTFGYLYGKLNGWNAISF